MVAFFALLLSMGTLQAQTPADCDLSKCSPEEREACAKRCATSASTTTSLVDMLLVGFQVEKPNCNPANCKKQGTTATAKLVSTEVKSTPTYGSDVVEETANATITEKKKGCATRCSKSKTSL